MIGREGESAKLEFESGVTVEGSIEKYTSNNSALGHTPSVITFKSGSCTVRFGEKTLFKPDWGTYDMLLMSELADSKSHLN